MRKVFAYLFILASIISSCWEDRLDRAMPDTESRGLSVYVAVGDPETKATVTNPGNDNGEEGMNENIIRTLDFFFFPKGSESGSATPYNHRFIADAGDVNNTCLISKLENVNEITGFQTKKSETFKRTFLGLFQIYCFLISTGI